MGVAVTAFGPLPAAARTLACVLVLGMPVAHAGESERRAGDVLAMALPIAALGAELGRGDAVGARQFLSSFALTLAATEVLKRSTHVERPDHSNDQSFPSGHASRAFAAAAFMRQRHGMDSAWPMYALATYVGHTRVQANRHRWSDVFGSAVVAEASSAALVTPRGPRRSLTFAPAAPHAPSLSLVVAPGGFGLRWTQPLP
jgi:membrane-associated phospholipid phosphatase